MIVQTRECRPGESAGELWCFEQHHHAVVSGEIAAAWIGADGDEAPDFEVVLATGMHDIGWIDADAAPSVSPDTGGPLDFVSLPQRTRLEIYRRGIDDMERLHPYAGLLGSLHFSAFVDADVAHGFVAAEAARRARLNAELGVEPAVVERDIELLRALDRLSLILCLTTPGVDPADEPEWLGRTFCVRGVNYTVEWDGPSRVTLDPWPLRQELRLRIPYRLLTPVTVGRAEDIGVAWRSAPVRELGISVDRSGI